MRREIRPPNGPVAFVAVDLGASSGRVMLGVVSGEALDVTEVHRFENRPLREDGGLQWNVDELFADTLAGLALAVQAATEQGAPLCGIGVDSWGVDFALLNAAGDIDGAVQHHRGAGDPQAAMARRGLSAQRVYERSGVLDQAINTSLRLSELVEAGAARDQRLLFVPDLWAYLLTGAVGTDATIASTSQLFDPAAGDWAADLLDAGGVASLGFPIVQASGTPVGRTTAEITQRIGAPVPVPVFRVGGHDTASAFAFADRESSKSDALISSGTWSVVGACVTEPLLTGRARELGFTNESGIEGTLLVQNLNGMWVLQQCVREWAAVDHGPIGLPALLDEAAAVPADARVFDVASTVLLASGAMVERVTRLCVDAGRPEPRTRAEVVRAIVDSLAAAYAGSITAVEALIGHRYDRVRLVGGGSKNRLLCQSTADAVGRPVLAGPAEASSIGNLAVQAGAHLGVRRIQTFYEHLSGFGVDVELFRPSTEPLPPRTGQDSR